MRYDSQSPQSISQTRRFATLLPLRGSLLDVCGVPVSLVGHRWIARILRASTMIPVYPSISTVNRNDDVAKKDLHTPINCGILGFVVS